jgi:hypothetical protein
MTIWIGLMQIGLCVSAASFSMLRLPAGQHWDMTFTYGTRVKLGIRRRLPTWDQLWECRKDIGSKAVFLSLAIAGHHAVFFHQMVAQWSRCLAHRDAARRGACRARVCASNASSSTAGCLLLGLDGLDRWQLFFAVWTLPKSDVNRKD